MPKLKILFALFCCSLSIHPAFGQGPPSPQSQPVDAQIQSLKETQELREKELELWEKEQEVKLKELRVEIGALDNKPL